MRQSHLFGRTLRDAPAEAQTPGHQLLLRAAVARPLASGLYTWLPLGFRVARKVEQIIREEEDRVGAQELRLPVITPAEYWKETGRWDALEPVTFRTRDHGGHEYMVAYTHEELVMHHARTEIQSYRQLPAVVYHFQEKGRDEARPRAGLLRVREFVMKDAYSIDKDMEGLERSYWLQYEAYARSFERMGLKAISVESDTGNMGGDVAHEFQVLTDVGEDRVVMCTACDHRANMEKARRRIDVAPAGAAAVPAPSEVPTPGIKTIPDLAAFLHAPAADLLKSLLFRLPSGERVLVLLPGDRDLGEPKLRKLLGVPNLAYAGDADFVALGAVAGSMGPVGLGSARVVVDASVEAGKPYVTGANKPDTHLRDVVLGRDYDGERADVHDVREGDVCPRCGGRLAIERGIEVGNIFKFGPYYADKMNATYLAEDGTRKPLMFGSYGIGIGRAVQTIIETNHDSRGIVWPMSVAPFEVHVVALPGKDAAVRGAAEAVVAEIEAAGVEVLYDDRDESAGVKFADADLLGIPFRVTVSTRGLKAGTIEVKARSRDDVENVPRAGAVARVVDLVTHERARYRLPAAPLGASTPIGTPA
ncbi:MAG: proline--tRNA ligase [Chloroflexota bacterium]|nr:proline--tRNA ligase [Chloroflexota bacterium]